MVSKKDKTAKQDAVDAAANMDDARLLAQQRIQYESIVGTTNKKDVFDAITIWLKLACKGNWCTKSVEDNKVRIVFDCDSYDYHDKHPPKSHIFLSDI